MEGFIKGVWAVCGVFAAILLGLLLLGILPNLRFNLSWAGQPPQVMSSEIQGGPHIAEQSPAGVVLTGAPHPAPPHMNGGPAMAPQREEAPRLGQLVGRNSVPASQEGGRCPTGQITYGEHARVCTGQELRPTGRECRTNPATGERECRPMRQ